MIKPDKQWKKDINNVMMTRSLKLSELACPCCHQVMVSPGIYGAAVLIKAEYGEGVIITSAYRCELHNMRVKGVPESRHLYGEAIDLQPREPGDIKTTEKILTTFRDKYKVIRYKAENYLHLQTI